MKPFIKIGIGVCLFSLLNFLNTPLTLAQVNSLDLGISLPITGDANDGDIICGYDSGLSRCNTEYDPTMYGVVASNPALEIADEEFDNARTIVTNGVVDVRISSVNGNVQEGNYVSSSSNPGVAQLATRNGYVLGVALEDFSSDNPDDIGTIQIALNIHAQSGLSTARSDLLQALRTGLAVPLLEPLDTFRYLLAIIMIIIAFALGLIYFGRSSRAGIEAVGRNPLARKTIQFTVFLNIMLTLVIVLVGLGVAYLILIL